MLNRILKISGFFIFIIFTTLLVIGGVRGMYGNPNEVELLSEEWNEEGPLELSPERGKFALTYSIVENDSFTFSIPIARFATPDVAYADGNYVSLFAPGLSFLLIPGYIIGKYFGASQIGTFVVIAIFAVINVLLIREITKKLGVSSGFATVSGLVFLFSTPAFAYASSLYQHHLSVFFILFAIYSILKFNKLASFLTVWFICALSITVDYPNFFLLFPIGVFSLLRFFDLKEIKKKIVISFKWPYIFTLVAFIPPLIFLGWFNKKSYGNIAQLAGTLPSVKVIDENGNPAAPENERQENIAYLENPELQEKSAIKFFSTRNFIKGSYTLLFSPDRGTIVYAPVVVMGLLGIRELLKKDENLKSLLLSIIGVNVLLYSMWGDPYGGWAFGSRYLIPSYALLCVFMAFALEKYKKSILFLTSLLILVVYSTGVNTIGAVTSNRNPPKEEVLAIEELSGKEEKYTFERNMDILSANNPKSFIFKVLAKDYVNAWQYTWGLIALIIIFILSQLTLGYMSSDKREKWKLI